ncbi:type III secretion protein [Pseudoroseomonas wenyumeiae]|uniref:Type III secretion protein n=2 Tax=Teichococcus wenyumeiae TaxID=2478470 RepID=A0A3A9JW02_9PROT|nr:type III secretion protein [Pseudoroseomonas wenyumeiae]RMI15575.1 type III secretion protein [Pseudoroseomonas wenyumeiae]
MVPLDDAALDQVTGGVGLQGGRLTFEDISFSVGEARRDALSTLSSSPSTAEMLALQQQVQQWSMLTQTQSTIVKELSDTLKGIVQKAS